MVEDSGKVVVQQEDSKERAQRASNDDDVKNKRLSVQ